MNKLIGLLTFAGVMLQAGCHTGPQIIAMDMLTQPHGAAVVIDAKQQGVRTRLHVAGELVDVRNDGVVLETSTSDGAQLSIIPWRVIYRVQASNLEGFRSVPVARGVPRAENVDRLRLISRFPQQLTAELLEKLLASYGQQSLVEITPGS